MDPFTKRRITAFAERFRTQNAVLPTLQDFESAGFPKELVDRAVRDEILVELYVTLTNGTIVKGYKNSGS